MPEQELISTSTSVSVVGTAMKIHIAYDEFGIYVFIAQEAGSIGGVGYKEGDGVTVINTTYETSTSFSMDSRGMLSVSAPDAANYSLDPLTGMLQYDDGT